MFPRGLKLFVLFFPCYRTKLFQWHSSVSQSALLSTFKAPPLPFPVLPILNEKRSEWMSQISLNLAWTWDWPIIPEIAANLPVYLPSFCFLFTVLHSSSAILAPGRYTVHQVCSKRETSILRWKTQATNRRGVNGNRLREREWCKNKDIPASTVLKSGLAQFIPKAHDIWVINTFISRASTFFLACILIS